MSGHIWANRLVVVVCGVLMAASVVFAAAWSALMPWAPAAPAALAVAPRAAHATVPEALIRDDFERDPAGALPAGWAVAGGRWGVAADGGGRVVRHAAGAPYGHLVAGSPAWTDYRVSATLRPYTMSTGFAGVMARYRDAGDYYACGVYYGSAVRLWRVRGGTMTVLDGRRMDVPGDRFHDVRLVAAGTRLSCVFDADVVLQATDASFPAGRIGFVAGADQAADFDDVVVDVPSTP
jgi:hypothetical protein